ncbi:MAG TPA: polyprenyl synthetase family protein [Gaiellales bacterium]|nr:polyprenyl synthetase family protein [Gaiellales bacterium]
MTVADLDAHLAGLRLSGVDGLDEAMRYSLEGGKRLRARLCLAACRAAGGDPQRALPAAVALELIQAFSLVHDDLPALDDDDLRRGRPSNHARFGEAVAVLAGDGLLNAAFLLAAERLETPDAVRAAVVAELARGVAGMIDGQYLDVTEGARSHEQLVRLHRLKTGALITAAVACGLHVAGLSGGGQRPYREFAAELGLLYQIVDDLLDGDVSDEPSYVSVFGVERTRELASASHARARWLLDEAGGDTDELAELTDLIAGRTA